MLDNPIWSALTTDHAALAEDGSLARRYPIMVTSLAALAEPSERAYAALGRLVGPGGQAGYDEASKKNTD